MLFQSSFDPALKSTQELIVFCHADQRCLLPLPENFEDALDAVRGEFGLDGPLLLETRDLAGWNGQSVKIHRSAWKGISALLGSVTVKRAINDTNEGVSHGKSVIPRLPKATASRRISSRVISRPSVAPRVQQLTPSSSTSFHGGCKSVVQKVHEEPGEDTQSDDETNSTAEKAQSSSTDAFSDDEEGDDSAAAPKVEAREDSPASQREDAEVFQPAQSAVLERQVTPPRSPVEQAPRSHQLEKQRAGPSSLRSPVSRSVSGPSWGEKTAPSDEVKVNTETIDNVKVRVEKASVARHAEPARSRSQSQSQSQSQQEAPSDERYLISVEYGSEESLFKTRGKHLISKVLMQACRTFGIEHLYDRAHMVMIVEAEEDGQTMEHRFLCGNEDTMARAGAESRSRFVIQVDEDVE